MKKILAIVGFITALVLTGCGAPAPDVEGQDWCYVFNFTENPQGFLLTTGTWTSQGIISDATGLLQTSYGYDRFVEPSFVIVTVVRPTGITGDISATAAGTIFGLSASFTATLPGGSDTAQLTFTPSEVGAAGTDVNITIDASQPIGIESIDVRGMGGSPFPFNSCSDATPTPFGITPSGTPSLSPSPDPSITPTLTATPEEQEFLWYYGLSIPPEMTLEDALLCDSGFSNRGIWTGTSCGIGTTDYGHIYVDLGAARVTKIEVGWEYCCGSTIYDLTIDGESQGALTPNNSAGPAADYLFNTDFTTSPVDIGVSGIMFLNYLRITYEAAPSSPTSTPTVATPTPGPTYTPEPLWSACLDFTAGQFAFTGTDATYEAGIGWIQDAGEWSIGRAGIGPSGKKKFKFTFDGAWAGSVRLTNTGGTPATAWKLGSGSQFVLDFSDQVWTPTQNLFIEFDGNYGPYTLEELCWVDLNPATNTPAPGSTSTPAGTRTPLATGTARPNPSRTPVQIPIPIIIITATNGVMITTTPIYGGTGVFYATGTPVMTGTPMGTPSDNGTGFGSGGGGFGDIGDMVGFAGQIGWGLLGSLIAYLGQATNIVSGLITAFIEATPQAIPGLPLCVTNPMAYDLCALWYILDNTLLAPNTAGQFIIPLVQIIFGICIAVYFVRWVLRLVRRGEDVTRVD